MEAPALRLVTVEEERRRLLQVVFEEFDTTGTWPSINRLARQLVQEMDVHEVIQGLGHPWIAASSSTEPKLELRLPAIAICKGSEDLTDAFMRTMQLAITKYLGAEPTPELTQAVLVAELGLSNLRAHQALILYQSENLWSSIQGQVPGDWIIKIDRQVRPYRDVKTLQDYIQRRYGADLAAFPIAGTKPSYRAPSKPEAAPLVFISHSGAPEAVARVTALLRESLGAGVQVWSDAELPGGRWDENIREQLAKTTAFVIVGSQAILRSVYVGFETGYVDARLGQRNVFMLRVGVEVGQLQNRPPLAHYQSFDATTVEGLRDFCIKLAQEIGTSLSEPPALLDHSKAFAQLATKQAAAHEAVKGPTTYEVAKQDLSFWDQISKRVCWPFGEAGARWIGRVLIGVGALAFAILILAGYRTSLAEVHPALFALILYVGPVGLLAGFGAIRAASHHEYRRCAYCHANYGLEEIGTPVAADLPVSEGQRSAIERITQRTFRCLNCGKERTSRSRRTIPARGL